MTSLPSKKTPLSVLVGLFAGVGLACSSSSTTPSTADAQTFGQSAAALSTSVDQYEAAASTATTQADCQTQLQQYLAKVEPLLTQLRTQSRQMDDYMAGHGAQVSADMDCGAQVMADELAHHQQVACAGDAVANRAELERHVQAMQQFADHMQMRAVQAGAMLGAQDAGWMMGYTDGGWRMGDGGMMGFGATIPGCTYAGGAWQPPDGGYWMDGGWTFDGGPMPMVDGGPFVMFDGGTFLDGGPFLDGGVMTDGGVMSDGGMMP